MKILLFVVNVDWFFLSHRLPIALAAQEQGYNVHVAVKITKHKAELEAHGFIVHDLDIVRGKTSPLQELKTLLHCFRLFRFIKPDLVHLVTIKPVIYGGLSARLCNIKAVVAAISGLGFVFVARSPIARLRKGLVGLLYKAALGHKRLRVIFQNPDDRANLMDIANLPADRTSLIRGSGIDLAAFNVKPSPTEIPVVAMACRLLKNKGVMEYVAAAKHIKATGRNVRFVLAGSIDTDNPDSLSDADVAVIAAAGHVELLGHCTDMIAFLQTANLVVLPSYYGEGLPKILVEAAACGRAVITTDMPGCRDAVVADQSGVLIPPRNTKALTLALETLLDNPERCAAMGAAGRALAERDFDIYTIVAEHLHIYATLLQEADLRE